MNKTLTLIVIFLLIISFFPLIVTSNGDDDSDRDKGGDSTDKDADSTDKDDSGSDKGIESDDIDRGKYGDDRDQKIKKKCDEKKKNRKNSDVKCRSEGTPEIPLYYVPFFMAGLFCVYALVRRKSGE